ncbi:MAG: flagellar regulator YcgR PilZN domain-containing protein [Pseudomonadota bacterium]
MDETASRTGHHTARVEKLTDPARIVAILKRLQAQRTLLTVTLPESDHFYTSILLNVRPDGSHFLLDELDPHLGHTQLLAAKKARIHGRLHGVEVNFASALRDVNTEADAALYTMSLPASLNYCQRRSYYRARVGMEHSIPVIIKRRNGETFNGQLEDISAGGVGVRLTGIADGLAHGDILPGCCIELSAGNKIFSDIEVRFLSADAQQQVLHLGGRFVDLGKVQARIVERFVATLDRETRKREKTK